MCRHGMHPSDHNVRPAPRHPDQRRLYFPPVCPNDTDVDPKLGVYGMNTTIGAGPQHWIESPRIGTSYEAAMPR